MIYKLININQLLSFTENDDISVTFVMLDKNNDIVTSLTGWTFAGEIENKLKLENTNFTVVGEKITLTIPHLEMGIMEGYYDLEIQGTLDEKIHTIYRENIRIINDIID